MIWSSSEKGELGGSGVDHPCLRFSLPDSVPRPMVLEIAFSRSKGLVAGGSSSEFGDFGENEEVSESSECGDSESSECGDFGEIGEDSEEE